MNRFQQRLANRPGRRQFLLAGATLTAGSAAALALACRGSSKDEGKSTPASSSAGSGTAAPGAAASGATPKRGGRIRLYNQTSTNNLNPVTNYVEGVVLSGVHVYDRLLSGRMDKDYLLEAAQSLEQPDPTTVIFKLKPGMKYHDRAPVNGRTVVADDIIKTQTYGRDNPRATERSFQTGALQSMDAPDNQTVVFKLKSPIAYLFSQSKLSNANAQGIIPREILDNLDTAWPIGSGPYQLAEYDLNVRYLYRRFPGYRDAAKGLPYIEEREFAILPDASAQEAAFRSEQLHIWQGNPGYPAVDPVRRDLGAKIDVDEWLSLGMFSLSFNVTKAPWNDVRVREAIYRAANRQQYLDLLEQGKGQVCPGTLPVGLTEFQVDAKQTEKYFRQDRNAAKQLLDAAGFPYNREVEMIVSEGVKNTQAAEIFQQQMAPLGVRVRIVTMPFAEWRGSRVATGNWESWFSGNPAFDTPEVPLRMQHSETFTVQIYNGLKDPQVDQMIAQSEVTLDRNARSKLVKDIQVALLEKYTPYYQLYSQTVYLPRYKFVKDYELNPSTQPMYRTAMWLDKS